MSSHQDNITPACSKICLKFVSSSFQICSLNISYVMQVYKSHVEIFIDLSVKQFQFPSPITGRSEFEHFE